MDKKLPVSLLPISYALGLMTRLKPLPFHIFTADGHYAEKFDDGQADTANVFKTDLHFRHEVLAQIRRDGVTIITRERPVIYAGTLCLGGICVIIGPVALHPLDQAFLKLYAARHNADHISIESCAPGSLAAFVLLIHASVSGEIISLSKFLDQFFLSEQALAGIRIKSAAVMDQHVISSRPHNPGFFEDRIRNSIAQGDVEGLKQALNSPYASLRGTLSRNETRSAKNLAIVDITIATRAAIDAGAGVEEMYVLSDAFILEVEEADNDEAARALARACAYACASKILELKKKLKHKDSVCAVVEKACDYIDRHINEKIAVADLALKLKVSIGYLDKLFKRDLGVTVSTHIRMRKIEIAKILLTTTARPLADIALQLSFSSQSHFGRVFLQLTGKSPARYREDHQLPGV